MGNPKAFLTIKRKEAGYRNINDRIKDFGEVEQTLNQEDRRLQASRCMDCGVPFCHWSCPLGNKQPEWQDRLYKNDIEGAYHLLIQTDDFPEFTGRICPALCEKGCVLNKTHEPVTVRENECAIIERAFDEGFVLPQIPKARKSEKIAVIGSGPSGLACANQLNQKGYNVTVFEKNEAVGGLLRFGIPDFKLNKSVIDRRINLMKEEGVEFVCNAHIGKEVTIKSILNDYDAVSVAIGTAVPRNIDIEGRDLNGIYFALDFLQQQNRLVAGEQLAASEKISAKGKNVLVIGGGDTGSDCVGTSNRQGARLVTQIEIMPKPPEIENPDTPWPYWPIILKTSSSHEEGCVRKWLLDSRRFIGENGKVIGVEVEEVEWKNENGRMNLLHTGKKEIIKADLVLLAMGFLHPAQDCIIEELGLETDSRKNIKVDENSMSSYDKVFACGDASTGASLVVRSIASGRKAAVGIDSYLKAKR